jgi:hypothetical protein
MNFHKMQNDGGIVIHVVQVGLDLIFVIDQVSVGRSMAIHGNHGVEISRTELVRAAVRQGT